MSCGRRLRRTPSCASVGDCEPSNWEGISCGTRHSLSGSSWTNFSAFSWEEDILEGVRPGRSIVGMSSAGSQFNQITSTGGLYELSLPDNPGGIQ